MLAIEAGTSLSFSPSFSSLADLIFKVTALIICCQKPIISKQWLQTMVIIYLLMNLKFGHGSVSIAFIPHGVGWGGLKDSWPRCGEAPLTNLVQRKPGGLVILSPSCAGQHVFLRSWHSSAFCSLHLFFFLIFLFIILSFCFFFGLLPWHMEVPRLGVESEM